MSDEERIASKFRRLVELREKRDESKVAAEDADVEYRRYEAELYDELEQSPMRGTRRIDLGGKYGTVRFTPRATTYGRVIDEAKAIEYFDKREQLASVSKPKLSKARLNEIVRERIEEGKPMPDGIDWYASRGITISRPKETSEGLSM